jgi:hypothetical protein
MSGMLEDTPVQERRRDACLIEETLVIKQHVEEMRHDSGSASYRRDSRHQQHVEETCVYKTWHVEETCVYTTCRRDLSIMCVLCVSSTACRRDLCVQDMTCSSHVSSLTTCRRDLCVEET